MTNMTPQDWQDAQAALVALEDYVAANEPPTTACPSWCTRPDGHPFTSYDGRLGEPITHERMHEAYSSQRVTVGAVEQVVDGRVTVLPAEAQLDYATSREAFVGSELRLLLRELHEAADVLERIAAGEL